MRIFEIVLCVQSVDDALHNEDRYSELRWREKFSLYLASGLVSPEICGQPGRPAIVSKDIGWSYPQTGLPVNLAHL